MPVCSYFLKGICSNSNCPYSHVYVSRKAEVCQDFLKGYCPMGEKVKSGPALGVSGRMRLCRSHKLFFARATAPKGAVELEPALDVMNSSPVPFQRVMGKVAWLPYRQGKKGNKLKAAARKCAGVSPGRASPGVSVLPESSARADSTCPENCPVK